MSMETTSAQEFLYEHLNFQRQNEHDGQALHIVLVGALRRHEFDPLGLLEAIGVAALTHVGVLHVRRRAGGGAECSPNRCTMRPM